MSNKVFWVGLMINAGAIVVNAWLNEWLGIASLVIIINIILLFIMRSSESAFLGEIAATAKLNNHLTKSEIGNQLKSMSQFIDEVKQTISVIDEIGTAKFQDIIKTIKNENIKDSFAAANQKIIDLRKKEHENTWITQGVAAISELKQKENSIAEYAYQVILTVVKFLGANQGGFFLFRQEGDSKFLELTASYAYGKKKYLEKRVNAGDGLLGQVIYEKEIIYMTDVPKDYVKITSGLGEALPRCICIVPLISEQKILGAFEIASFEKITLAQLEYLKEISETIGYNLGAIETHHRTERLLNESQQMAQEVKAQEEELRQNMEELTATQEQMRRKQSEMDAVFSSLSTVELDLKGHILQANEIFLSITGYKPEAIIGKLYKSLIPQHGNDPIQYEMMWSSILSGRTFSGEFRIVNGSGKEMWMAGNFTPIMDESGTPYKVMVISLFTTQDKEKLFELQEMVTAIRSSFPMTEITPEMTFKSASDLFLSELGIKRLELKKLLPANVFTNGSYSRVEAFLKDNSDQPDHLMLDMKDKNGVSKRFNSTLIKVSGGTSYAKKGLIILRNAL